MQIWTFSKHHTFKYDFREKTQYSNMNFWCFLVTPGPDKSITRHQPGGICTYKNQNSKSLLKCYDFLFEGARCKWEHNPVQDKDCNCTEEADVHIL